MEPKDDINEISTNNLYLRPGETIEIFRYKPDLVADYERLYTVAFVETPPFPNPETPVHVNTKGLAVIAAEIYATKASGEYPCIGWVNLGADTREVIGRHLERRGAGAGDWFYMILKPDLSPKMPGDTFKEEA